MYSKIKNAFVGEYTGPAKLGGGLEGHAPPLFCQAKLYMVLDFRFQLKYQIFR